MPPIWRMTPDELKENLTRLTVILQRSMDHASQHRLINQMCAASGSKMSTSFSVKIELLHLTISRRGVSAMHTHDMGYLDERVNGSINQHVMRESYIQIAGALPPTPVAQSSPQTGIKLVGTKLHMKDLNTGYGHATLSGDIISLSITMGGPQTRIVSQELLEELAS
ncbi:hypothetical protein EV359DRAFT_60498 [Lentinula novae-zelandiae]|nr:hypothetical protein EV359DRAFT_60498 [Lentinula novae-zelandiae]